MSPPADPAKNGGRIPQFIEVRRQKHVMDAILVNRRCCEILPKDRLWHVGDVLEFRCYDPRRDILVGNPLRREIWYIEHGPMHGLEPGYIMVTHRFWQGEWEHVVLP
jgi:hypothetical protein